MLAGSTRDRQHVVERHRHVGDRDLPYGLAERLARRPGDHAISIDILVVQRRFGVLMMCGRRAQLAPHLPAHPKQENAAGQQQSDDLKQLHRDARETDSQYGGGEDADQNRLFVGSRANRRLPVR